MTWITFIPAGIAVALTLLAVAILYSDMYSNAVHRPYTRAELEQLPPDCRTIQAREFGVVEDDDQ